MNPAPMQPEADDAGLIEACLVAVADRNIDIRLDLFERFLDEFPQQRPAFLNLDAASRRMTDETLQILYGLAQGEGWVWPLVAELVGTHRNYGALTVDEYDAFIDMTVDAVRDAAAAIWSEQHGAAWTRQSAALKAMIRRAGNEWDQALPGSVVMGTPG